MSETLAPVSMSANTCIFMSVTEEERRKKMSLGLNFFENVKLSNYDEIPTFLMY